MSGVQAAAARMSSTNGCYWYNFLRERCNNEVLQRDANAQIRVESYGQYVGQKLIKQFVSERGCSQEEARTFLKLNQTWVMCEDSGLFIPALNGLPGPWSARFDD